MQNNGLLFIPDISGFSSFINSTEIEHSRHIISELLSKIMDANELELVVSEIEGDAVLFYKFGPPPNFDQLITQVEKMFLDFHRHILNYDQQRVCNCGACESAPDLTLKIITHYGEFSTYKVQEYEKLFGKSVIVAHRLLKNDIIGNEYWLMTESLHNHLTIVDTKAGLNWENGMQQFDQIDVSFYYAKLTALRANLDTEPSRIASLDKQLKADLVISRIIEANMYDLAQVVTNLPLRPQWLVGVKEIKESDHKINQIGNTHTCIVANRRDFITTTKFKRNDSIISYAELIKGMGELNFTFEKIEKSKTLLTIKFNLTMNPLMKMMFSVLKKRGMKHDLNVSIDRLSQLVQPT